jgi:hypothetical protein
LAKQKTPNHEKLREEILNIHRNLIAAHLNNDPDHFKGATSDDFLSVVNGEIRKPARAEVEAGLQKYIENTRFTEYRDLTEPIIGFSEDGSTAWSIVQVKVAGSKRDTGKPIDFTCAWLTLYRREGENWVKLAEVSTFK